MTVEIVLRRDANGRLSAKVKQGPHYGRDLLERRTIRDVVLAKVKAREALAASFQSLGTLQPIGKDLEVVWTVIA